MLCIGSLERCLHMNECHCVECHCSQQLSDVMLSLLWWHTLIQWYSVQFINMTFTVLVLRKALHASPPVHVGATAQEDYFSEHVGQKTEETKYSLLNNSNNKRV